MELEKEYVQWTNIEQYVNNVCEKYKDRKLTGVFGLPRGGLVFAVMISHKLNIPLLMSPATGCLIVDDISDTGESLLHYNNNGYLISTMFYRIGSLVVPDYWQYKKTNKWIVYPWEC